MHRWVSLSSSVRRTLARFASCSTGSSTSSIAIRGSSSRTAPTSSGSSASWSSAAEVSSQEPSRRSTASSSSSPSSTARGDACSGRPSARSSSGGSPSGTRPVRLGFAGYADALGRTLAELDGALLEPEDVGEPLAELFGAYRRELEPPRRVGSRRASPSRDRAPDERARRVARGAGLRPRLRGSHRSRVATPRGALRSDGRPRLVCPTSPAGAVYASLSRTVDDLARLADGDVVELPPRSHDFLPPALAHIERELFAESPSRSPLDSSVRFLEGAGGRGTLELVADEVLGLVRSGVAAEEIAVVCPSVESVRLALEAAFGSRRCPGRVRESRRAADDPVRARPARPAALRLAGRRATRALCAPALAVLRRPAPGRRLDRRPPARARRAPWRSRDRRDGRAPRRSSAPDPRAGAGRGAALDDGQAAGGRDAEARPRDDCATARRPVAARPAGPRRRHPHARRARSARLRPGSSSGRADLLSALERATVRRERAGAPGRVAVLDLLRARTRRFDTVFVLGLEQGSLPRRPRSEPFLDDDTRRRTRRSARGSARATRRSEPRPLPLRDGVLAPPPAARPRPPGGRRRRLAAGAEPVLGERPRALRRRRRPASHGAAAALGAHPRARGGPDRARAAALARRAREPESRGGRSAGARERLEQTARASHVGVRPPHPADARARAPARRGSRLVLGLRARADGVVLRRLVRRAVPPARDDRQGDRPHDARLDPPRGAAALLPAAAERRSRRGSRHAREPRGGDRADARVCRTGGRDRSSDRRRRPRSARARAGAAP